MPVLKIDLEQPAYERLVERAAIERRPANWQAEIELKRRFGLWPEFNIEAIDRTSVGVK